MIERVAAERVVALIGEMRWILRRQVALAVFQVALVILATVDVCLGNRSWRILAAIIPYFLAVGYSELLNGRWKRLQAEVEKEIGDAERRT